MKALRHATRAAVFHAAIWQSERSTALLKWTMTRLGLPIADSSSPRPAGSAPVDREPAPTPAPPVAVRLPQPQDLSQVDLDFVSTPRLCGELGKRHEVLVIFGANYRTETHGDCLLYWAGMDQGEVAAYFRAAAVVVDRNRGAL